MGFPEDIPISEIYRIVEKKETKTKVEKEFLEKEKYYQEIIASLKAQLFAKENPKSDEAPIFTNPAEKILLPDGKAGEEYREN